MIYELIPEVLRIALFALAHAYMGRTLPGRIYLPFGNDQVAYAIMAATCYPDLGLWGSVASFFAFWIMLGPSPRTLAPLIGKLDEWFPFGSRRERWRIAARLAVGSTIKGVPLQAIFLYVTGNPAIILSGCGVGLGYFAGSALQVRGDNEGKLCSGALLGLATVAKI